MEIENSIKAFRELIITKTGSINTARTYSCEWGKYLAYFKHIAEPKAITAEMIISYLATIPGCSSRCSAHSAIKLWYKWKSPHEESTKFKYIPYPLKLETIPDHVTIEDFISIMQVCENPKHKCVVLLGFDCGFRVSEVVNLKLTDIDRQLMNINIRQSKGRKDRILKLTTATLSFINLYIEKEHPVVYLFNGQAGIGQYTIRSCQQLFSDLCKEAKVKHYKFHALRHGFAMALYETGGYSLETIRDLLGHKDVSTTQVYARKNNIIIQRTLSPVEILMREKGVSGNQLLQLTA